MLQKALISNPTHISRRQILSYCSRSQIIHLEASSELHFGHSPVHNLELIKFGGWMGGMWFFPLLFWILLIVGAVFIIRWLRERKEGQQESSLDIPKRRYASGEIDRNTFEQLKKDI